MFLCIALAIGGVWLSLFASNRFYQQLANSYSSLRWPKTEGEVTSTLKRATENADGLHGCAASIQYQYTVAGRTYQNDVDRYIGGATPVATCENVGRLYPKGRKVDVFYNPSEPQQAVLVRGDFSQTSFILIPISICLIIGALALLIFLLLKDLHRVYHAKLDGSGHYLLDPKS